MAGTKQRGRLVRRYLLERIGAGSANAVHETARQFNVTRQAVNKHLRRLLSDGHVEVRGTTRNRRYTLAVIQKEKIELALDAQLDENVIWTRNIAPILSELSSSASRIWAYGFHEMLNNAIDHSSGRKVIVTVTRNIARTAMIIMDDGYGIFRKIKESMDLEDERHAAFELSKGKLTTAPDNHTGESIFVTSQMFDSFAIFSGSVVFIHDESDSRYWVFERDNPVAGTVVCLELANATERTVKEIFDQFTNGDYAFSKTVVPVNLATYEDDALLSRAQARRVLMRIDRFSTVLLDFTDVEQVGQAFADEVFRIFARTHPQIEIVPIHANSQVMSMINRAYSHRK